MPTKQKTIKTNQSEEVIDLTEKIQKEIKEVGLKEGKVTLFIKHTTAALTTADLDPGTDKDMLEAFYEMIPDLDYRHPHNPEHVPDHILSTLIGPSVTFIVQNGEIQLGTWQRIVLFEFNGPRERKVLINISK